MFLIRKCFFNCISLCLFCLLSFCAGAEWIRTISPDGKLKKSDSSYCSKMSSLSVQVWDGSREITVDVCKHKQWAIFTFLGFMALQTCTKNKTHVLFCVVLYKTLFKTCADAKHMFVLFVHLSTSALFSPQRSSLTVDQVRLVNANAQSGHRSCSLMAPSIITASPSWALCLYPTHKHKLFSLHQSTWWSKEQYIIFLHPRSAGDAFEN